MNLFIYPPPRKPIMFAKIENYTRIFLISFTQEFVMLTALKPFL